MQIVHQISCPCGKSLLRTKTTVILISNKRRRIFDPATVFTLFAADTVDKRSETPFFPPSRCGPSTIATLVYRALRLLQTPLYNTYYRTVRNHAGPRADRAPFFPLHGQRGNRRGYRLQQRSGPYLGHSVEQGLQHPLQECEQGLAANPKSLHRELRHESGRNYAAPDSENQAHDVGIFLCGWRGVEVLLCSPDMIVSMDEGCWCRWTICSRVLWRRIPSL